MNNGSTNKRLISDEERLVNIILRQIREITRLNQKNDGAKLKQPLYLVWDPTHEYLSVFKKVDNVYEAIRLAAVYVYHKNVGMSEYNRRTSYTLQGYSQKMTVPALWKILQPVLNIKKDYTTGAMINIDRQQFKNMIKKLVELRKSILGKAKQTKEEYTQNQLTIESERKRAEERQRLNDLKPILEQRKIIENWQKLFREYFDIEDINLSNIKIPEAWKDVNFPIYVPKGLTYNQLWKACKVMFNGKVLTYNEAGRSSGKSPSSSLDLSKEERLSSNGSYCVLCYNKQMADEANKNRSADEISRCDSSTMTLMERLLFGLYYYKYNGKHLDTNSWTLCSGSRFKSGYVPWVAWYKEGVFSVSCRETSYHFDNMRARLIRQ